MENNWKYRIRITLLTSFNTVAEESIKNPLWSAHFVLIVNRWNCYFSTSMRYNKSHLPHNKMNKKGSYLRTSLSYCIYIFSISCCGLSWKLNIKDTMQKKVQQGGGHDRGGVPGEGNVGLSQWPARSQGWGGRLLEQDDTQASQPLQPVVFGHLPGSAPSLQRDRNHWFLKSMGTTWEQHTFSSLCVWDDLAELHTELFESSNKNGTAFFQKSAYQAGLIIVVESDVARISHSHSTRLRSGDCGHTDLWFTSFFILSKPFMTPCALQGWIGIHCVHLLMCSSFLYFVSSLVCWSVCHRHK